eukprot:6472286-Amphidinium_carterae.2
MTAHVLTLLRILPCAVPSKKWPYSSYEFERRDTGQSAKEIGLHLELVHGKSAVVLLSLAPPARTMARECAVHVGFQ